MVEISIQDGSLVCEVEGMHKVWACKSRLVIPLGHVQTAAVRTEATQTSWHGWKLIGTDLPGVSVTCPLKVRAPLSPELKGSRIPGPAHFRKAST